MLRKVTYVYSQYKSRAEQKGGVIQACIAFRSQNRQQMSPVGSVFNMEPFKCHHMSARDSGSVVGEMAFARSLQPALTLLDSRGGQTVTGRITPNLQNLEALSQLLKQH